MKKFCPRSGSIQSNAAAVCVFCQNTMSAAGDSFTSTVPRRWGNLKDFICSTEEYFVYGHLKHGEVRREGEEQSAGLFLGNIKSG